MESYYMMVGKTIQSGAIQLKKLLTAELRLWEIHGILSMYIQQIRFLTQAAPKFTAT